MSSQDGLYGDQQGSYAVFFAMITEDPEIKSAVMQDYPDIYHIAATPRGRDKSAAEPHTKSMNDITRHELDAKLETIEARMDGRVASIESKIDGFLSAQAERDKRFQQALELSRQQSDKQSQQMDQRLQRMDTSIDEIKNSLGAQKYWLAGIGVAVILGIMSANATIFSGAKSFFDGGVEQSEVRALLEDTRAQSVEVRALIEGHDIAPTSSAAPAAAPGSNAKPPELQLAE